jgi:hypothetical protein
VIFFIDNASSFSSILSGLKIGSVIDENSDKKKKKKEGKEKKIKEEKGEKKKEKTEDIIITIDA